MTLKSLAVWCPVCESFTHNEGHEPQGWWANVLVGFQLWFLSRIARTFSVRAFVAGGRKPRLVYRKD